GTPDEIYDHPVSPFVFGFIGQSNALAVTLQNGEIWFEDRPIGLRAPSEPDGPANLHFRPHDIELIDGCGGCLAGLVTASRRVAGTRHLELDLGRNHPHVEIELSPERAAAGDHSRIAFRPTKWKLFRDNREQAATTAPARAEQQDAEESAETEAFELARTGT
ncbi:TOBE-like domain-containing protein, partial [Sinorhizobium sp. NFACC03]|uniref:TOBE-like domain-containing protein n=1 Tax=Sinorhizobium sp. NFACC03 TaxID=1566295 RepID=UPI0008923299